MKWFLVISALLCVVPVFLFVRLLCKRISLVCRLKSVCKAKKLELIPTHRAWWLGWTKGTNADFHVITAEATYSVKLIGTISKRICFNFLDVKNYSTKNMMFQFSQAAFGIQYEPKTKNPYNFDYKLPDEHLRKNRENVILMNPVPLVVNVTTQKEQRKPIENGDRIKEGIFFSGDGFVRKLR